MGVESGGRCDDRFRVLASLPEVIKYVEILGPHKPAYSQDEADDIGFCLLNFWVIDDFSGVEPSEGKVNSISSYQGFKVGMRSYSNRIAGSPQSDCEGQVWLNIAVRPNCQYGDSQCPSRRMG